MVRVRYTPEESTQRWVAGIKRAYAQGKPVGWAQERRDKWYANTVGEDQ
ncbi:hypothetical protein KJ972_00340 [Candidatus Micrarchaeota archaeon]|nr:hypothetical protein [Patescibacteria group bacterium]MBU1929933.1 hypothetical protein [Candidatus Micrarchaeota archaeon]